MVDAFISLRDGIGFQVLYVIEIIWNRKFISFERFMDEQGYIKIDPRTYRPK